MSRELIQRYYEAFNRKDMKTFLSMLAEDVEHDINQGPRHVGRAKFASFMEQMNACYDEKVVDLVVLTDTLGRRAAAEFIIEGKYLKSQDGLPPARGQTYRLPVGAFFEIENGEIQRVTNYYNLQDWIRQVET